MAPLRLAGGSRARLRRLCPPSRAATQRRPDGAVLYRLATLLAEEWRAEMPRGDITPLARDRGAFGRPAREVLGVLDWVPVRLTALSFAVVGDFEDAVYCWRTQSAHWPGAD